MSYEFDLIYDCFTSLVCLLTIIIIIMLNKIEVEYWDCEGNWDWDWRGSLQSSSRRWKMAEHSCWLVGSRAHHELASLIWCASDPTMRELPLSRCCHVLDWRGLFIHLHLLINHLSLIIYYYPSIIADTWF